MDTTGLPAVIGVAMLTVEGLVEIITSIRDPQTRAWNMKLVYTVLCGVTIALMIPQFDLYKIGGIAIFPPVAGRILTGILASRGAKFVHDFLGIVEAWKNNLKGAGTSGDTTPTDNAPNNTTPTAPVAPAPVPAPIVPTGYTAPINPVNPTQY